MICIKPTKRIAWRFRGLFFGLISIASLSNVYAAGSSEGSIFGLSNLPCDGVAYPVVISHHIYSVPAGTRIRLPVNSKSILSVSNSTSTSNSVSKSWDSTDKFTFSASVGEGPIKVTVGYETSYSIGEVVTNGSTTSFADSNTIELIAKVEEVTATPSLFKIQGWGSRYRCEPNQGILRLAPLGAMSFDFAYAQGWVLETNMEPSNPSTDYAPPVSTPR